MSRQSKHLQLSESISPEQVSQAWAYLSSLPESPLQPQPPLPENLKHLSDADWHLLDSLLMRELNLKLTSQLH